MENILEKAKQAYAENCGSSNFEELKYMSSENEGILTSNALLFYGKTEKSKYFAQYWGQNVMVLDGLPSTVDSWFEGNNVKSFHLLLKPLSSITDEDAIEVAKIASNSITNVDTGDLITLFYTEVKKDPYVLAFASYETVDYLRSKGFALPWMGLSVEKLIEYGWLKLSE